MELFFNFQFERACIHVFSDLREEIELVNKTLSRKLCAHV